MQYNMKRHHKSAWRTVFSPQASLGVNLQAPWTHIWSEHRKASGCRRLVPSPRGCGVVIPRSLLPLPDNAGREMEATKQQGSEKNNPQLQSLCSQMSTDIAFIFTGKLMAEENFNFPLAAKHHWRLSYLQQPSVCTTVLLPEFQYALLHWSSRALTMFNSRNTCSVSNLQLSMIKM